MSRAPGFPAKGSPDPYRRITEELERALYARRVLGFTDMLWAIGAVLALIVVLAVVAITRLL
jgi:hypothetical protein